MRGINVRGLYAIVDPASCLGRDPAAVARAALAGGARVVQWRDKTRDKGDQLPDLRRIAVACREHGVRLIVNDHVDLALAVDAAGVHLGQRDLPLVAARRIAPQLEFGVSTNTVEEARRAEAEGADYVAVGAIFATGSKETTRPASIERLRAVKAAVRVPVVAIGGIGAANIGEVVAAGADAAAVISAVCGADDVCAAAAELARVFSTGGDAG
jgi:thiamine-phosphate diphosphorylase